MEKILISQSVDEFCVDDINIDVADEDFVGEIAEVDVNIFNTIILKNIIVTRTLSAKNAQHKVRFYGYDVRFPETYSLRDTQMESRLKYFVISAARQEIRLINHVDRDKENDSSHDS
jgi:hypothetical protein